MNEMNQTHTSAFSHQPEVIQRTLRRHLVNLAAPLMWSIAMLLPLVFVGLAIGGLGLNQPSVLAGLWLFGGLYVVFVSSFFMMQWVFWYLDAWMITEHRLIDVQLVTLFNRRVSHLPLNQVQDVRVQTRGSLASLFGFGDITVQSAGKEGFFEMRSIPNAQTVATQINQLVTARQEGIFRPAPPVVTKPTQRLGDVLVARGIITTEDLAAALQDQQHTGKQLGRLLLERNLISRDDLVQALGTQYRMPSLDLSRYQIDADIVREMSHEIAARYTAIPIARSPETLTVAVADPSPNTLGELAAQLDTPLAFMVADEDYIKEAITGYYLAATESGSQPMSPGGDLFE